MGWQDAPLVDEASREDAPPVTKLPPQQELQYRGWLSSLGMTKANGYAFDDNWTGTDYDMRGFFKKYGAADVNVEGGQHFTDEFKLPNHETFSDQSIYAVGANKAKAGRWDGDTYVPPRSNQPAWMSAPLVEDPDAPTDGLRSTALVGRAVGEGVLGTLLSGAEQFGKFQRGDISGLEDAYLERHTGKNRFQHEIASFNEQFGTEIPEARSVGDLLSALLTKAGAPVPETNNEKLYSAGIRGASGALAVPGVPSPLLAAMGGTTGALASEKVKQEGYGPKAQMAAGMVGGIVGGTPASVTTGTLRGIGGALTPAFEFGRRAVAGRALNMAASNSERAIANLEGEVTHVAGSAPTTGAGREGCRARVLRESATGSRR